FVRARQQVDGALQWPEMLDVKGNPQLAVEGTNLFPGPALYGVMRSHAVRPAPWKLELVRKACAYYVAWWREHKSPAMVPWHSAAYAEAYLISKEPGFADAVNEMNDWLVGLQYQTLDPRRPLWLGGFQGWQDGRAVAVAPTIHSALLAGSLVEGCRVARQAGDVPRLGDYRRAA